MGRPERVACLFAAARALRDAIGAPLPPYQCARLERRVAAARDDLGEEAFAIRWGEGQAMPLEQAIAAALQETVPV
jgi:hypothetical protein